VVLVSIAGPISNLILTAAALLILFVMKSAGVIQSVPTPIIEFFYLFIQLNTVLFIFNLLPLPPLDGYRVVEDLLPNDARAKLTQYETYGSVIFLILVLTPLSHYTIQPIFNYAVPWVLNILGFYHIFI
jgi:Zn-dependent protease